MKRTRMTRILAATAASAALAAVAAAPASGATLARQTFCNGAEPNAIGALIGPIAAGCELGVYNPATESYAPYDPATDDNGLLGLNSYVEQLGLEIDTLGL